MADVSLILNILSSSNGKRKQVDQQVGDQSLAGQADGHTVLHDNNAVSLLSVRCQQDEIFASDADDALHFVFVGMLIGN